MSRHKIPMKGADEMDALCRKSRRIIASFDYPGVAKKAKRRYNKRERRYLNNKRRDDE